MCTFTMCVFAPQLMKKQENDQKHWHDYKATQSVCFWAPVVAIPTFCVDLELSYRWILICL